MTLSCMTAKRTPVRDSPAMGRGEDASDLALHSHRAPGSPTADGEAGTRGLRRVWPPPFWPDYPEVRCFSSPPVLGMRAVHSGSASSQPFPEGI